MQVKKFGNKSINIPLIKNNKKPNFITTKIEDEFREKYKDAFEVKIKKISSITQTDSQEKNQQILIIIN